MQELNRIIEFIIKHFDHCDWDSGYGKKLELPNYELMPFDYLEFAKINLDTNSSGALIDCVGNLKRALDCQLDIFIHAIKLEDLFLKKNLKFDRKLEAIKLLGIIESKSLSILNHKRNKMEHEHIIPEIQDLQTYYELVVAFCLVLEANIQMLSIYGSFDWVYDTPEITIDNSHYMVGLNVQFKQEKPSITFEVHDPEFGDYSITFSPKDRDSTTNYLKALNVFFILCRADMVLSKRCAKALLQDLSKT